MLFRLQWNKLHRRHLLHEALRLRKAKPSPPNQLHQNHQSPYFLSAQTSSPNLLSKNLPTHQPTSLLLPNLSSHPPNPSKTPLSLTQQPLHQPTSPPPTSTSAPPTSSKVAIGNTAW